MPINAMCINRKSPALMLFGKPLTNETIRDLFFTNPPPELNDLSLVYYDTGELLIKVTSPYDYEKLVETIIPGLTRLNVQLAYRSQKDRRITGFSRYLKRAEKEPSLTIRDILTPLDQIVSSFHGDYDLFGNDKDQVDIQINSAGGKPRGFMYCSNTWDAEITASNSRLTTLVYHHTNPSSNKLIEELNAFYKAE